MQKVPKSIDNLPAAGRPSLQLQVHATTTDDGTLAKHKRLLFGHICMAHQVATRGMLVLFASS
uniref:Uncharacterized protein n=1 Tax=Oryza sativa subsp. japonica TaxID=39947 RepID=Q6K7I4_ORYSJ|nr:hypothetical protein [Oryza sativa Japonica Group]